LDTKTEFTRYLKPLVMPRETGVYYYWKAKKRNIPTGDSVRMIMCLKDSGIITDEDVVEDEA
jgi:hypothetical protein